MILDKQIYPIYGKDLKKFIKLLSNLKDITVRYSTKNGDEYSFLELIKSADLKTNGRN